VPSTIIGTEIRNGDPAVTAERYSSRTVHRPVYISIGTREVTMIPPAPFAFGCVVGLVIHHPLVLTRHPLRGADFDHIEITHRIGQMSEIVG
jgi:hypothetical protein